MLSRQNRDQQLGFATPVIILDLILDLPNMEVVIAKKINNKPMNIVKLTTTNQQQIVNQAVKVLQSGGLIIYPTETVYGLGVDATNQKAIDKLLAYKSRREGKPLSVAVANQKMAEQFVELNDQARALYQQFLPGPITIISLIRHRLSHSRHSGLVENPATAMDSGSSTSAINPTSISYHQPIQSEHQLPTIHQPPTTSNQQPANNNQYPLTSHQPPATSNQLPTTSHLALGVASEFDTLGIRIPDYPLVIDIVQQLGTPITATSANASGKRRPYSVDQILINLSDTQRNLIDLIIDAGTLPKRPPSTVIDTTLSTPIIVRQGALLKNSQSNTTKLTSRSEAETKAISGKIVLKNWDVIEKSPIVIGLNGPLGAGKTVFAKGVAEFLGITTPIVSPTYSYTEEYNFKRYATQGKLIHADVWKVDSAGMLARIGLIENLQPNTIFIIEWFSQVAVWLQPSLQTSKATLIQVNISDQDPIREIDIITC